VDVHPAKKEESWHGQAVALMPDIEILDAPCSYQLEKDTQHWELAEPKPHWLDPVLKRA
jgi:hypothetical protein